MPIHMFGGNLLFNLSGWTLKKRKTDYALGTTTPYDILRSDCSSVLLFLWMHALPVIWELFRRSDCALNRPVYESFTGPCVTDRWS